MAIFFMTYFCRARGAMPSLANLDLLLNPPGLGGVCPGEVCLPMGGFAQVGVCQPPCEKND